MLLANHTATTEIYTLSLHDALPIYAGDDPGTAFHQPAHEDREGLLAHEARKHLHEGHGGGLVRFRQRGEYGLDGDRKSTRLNSSHTVISYAVFCLKKKKQTHPQRHT